MKLFLYLLSSVISNDNGIDYWDDSPGFLKRSHSLISPFSGNLPLWELKGDSMATSEYIRLTSDDQSRNGAAWSRVPVSFPWWEIQLAYKIHGSGKSVAADGMGLFLVKERTKTGGAIGGPEQFQGFALLLDSYKNGQTTGNFPLISGFVNNGTWKFDHDNDGDGQNIGKCLSGHRNKNKASLIRIRYLDDVITVRVDPDGSGDFRKTCFESTGVILPTGLYLGITSATGDLTDNHDVHGLKIWQLDSKKKYEEPFNSRTIDVLKPVTDTPIEEKSSGGSGWFMFFILLLVACGGGFWYYQEKQKQDAKRFY